MLLCTQNISFERLQMGLQDKGYEEWVGEMIGMREILQHFSNVTKSEVVGMRAPFLKPGRNTQYKVIFFFKLNVIIFSFDFLEGFGRLWLHLRQFHWRSSVTYSSLALYFGLQNSARM